MQQNRLTQLFKIEYPIVQGGMVWVSGWKLAAAVSNAGGLGLIGAGSMAPDLLKEHILRAQQSTNLPFGVNIPLLYEKSKEQIDCALSLGVKIFFTSAGAPKLYTNYLKSKNVIVVHVTSTPELAVKCEEAGVDAVVVEGFEAGGHNGRAEITTFALVPQVKSCVKIPIIAAGGIANGRGMLAAIALGADGIQMGTRFLMSKESSAHEAFKSYALLAKSDSTQLKMKSLVPVRLLRNQFSDEMTSLEEIYTGEELKERLRSHLGKYRAKKGMLEGDIVNGELEIGQIISLIKDVPSVAEIIRQTVDEYQETLSNLSSFSTR